MLTELEALRRAVARAAQRGDGYLAHRLGTALDDVAARLGTPDQPVTPLQAGLLLLCKRPRPERWDEDVTEIAVYTGVDRERLAAVLAASTEGSLP